MTSPGFSRAVGDREWICPYDRSLYVGIRTLTMQSTLTVILHNFDVFGQSHRLG
jgi:hypothetical protein